LHIVKENPTKSSAADDPDTDLVGIVADGKADRSSTLPGSIFTLW
jgi:hypothetical protein